jgi:hypothetical protein
MLVDVPMLVDVRPIAARMGVSPSRRTHQQRGAGKHNSN